MAGQYQLRIRIEKMSQGDLTQSDAIKQSVGNGATIMTASGGISAEGVSVTDIIITDAQVLGLFGYIGLLNADINSNGISTASIETAVASVVGAN